jgi:SAM-dependent methyltransferase
MNAPEMQIADPAVALISKEADILDELLPLSGVSILELGCGKAEMTRLVAAKAASVLALEVDEIQLAKNREITDLPNVEFGHGGAEQIPAPDAAFDIVLMFKSLHHVPLEMMGRVFPEIHRVLKPGGLAYISEPVYDGDFNEILKLFHDEREVREAAFSAIRQATQSGYFELQQQKFFLNPMHFDDFVQFEERILKVSHTEHRLSPELYAEVRSRFEKHMTSVGADFHMPVRVDLLHRCD